MKKNPMRYTISFYLTIILWRVNYEYIYIYIYAKIMHLNMQKSTWHAKTSSIFFNYS